MANWLSLDHAFQQGPQLCHHSRRSLRYGVILTDIHFSLLSILPLVAVATRFLCLTVTVQSAMQGALHHLRLANHDYGSQAYYGKSMVSALQTYG